MREYCGWCVAHVSVYAAVGTARYAVRAPYEGRNVCVTCTCGTIGSARSDAGMDIAGAMSLPANLVLRTQPRSGPGLTPLQFLLRALATASSSAVPRRLRAMIFPSPSRR